MAERFGWTPEQVDNLPAGTADWLLAIARITEEVKNRSTPFFITVPSPATRPLISKRTCLSLSFHTQSGSDL
jgi:hypothetical protein